MARRRPLELSTLVAGLALLTGCPGQEPPSPQAPAAWSVVKAEALSASEQEKRTRGVAARDAMAQRLLSSLETALAGGGPAAAIDVCARLAPDIARQVGEEKALRLGRTSFRLRNPKNVPPPWAAPLLADRPAAEVVARGPEGRVGLLLPIRLGPMCVQCHGPADALAPDVRAALAASYPADEATGFAPGDLRGWFWVEVP